MSRHAFLKFAAIALLSVCALRAEAPAVDAAAMLRGAVDEVMAIAYDTNNTAVPLSERVKPTLEKYFSFENVTRRAIGPGWRQFTPEQKTRTTQLFSDLVIRTYANRFEPGERPGITYSKAITPNPERPTMQELPTTIEYAGKKYAVSYRVEQVKGGWLIYDVIIEGVSMIANWRSQLDPIYQKGGAAAVIVSLEKNLSQEVSK
jgi:phospholipid transport system substrate-binding protein